jgi:tetratricopeptide (TPR) repeat protein
MIGARISHYEIIEQLGRGGMGVVYRATDTKLGREVALKFLPDSFATLNDADVLDRFTREARSAAALNHPHICTIYEIGEHEGRPFIAMELLEGRTLAGEISGRPIAIGHSIELGLQIASALEAAAAKGIVHRDIKPANIFITTSGSAKILDFGLAKSASSTVVKADAATTADGANLTVVGSTLGTVAYMSPEQARGQDLDGRSDVFSLGLVLYEMVTGRQAFGGDTTAVIFDGILNRTPAAPSTLNSDVPADLERIIACAIEKDRERRYQSAGELAADLRALKKRTESGGVMATTAVAAPSSGTAWPSAAAQPAVAAPVQNEGKRRGLKSAVWLSMAAVALIVGGVAWWQLRGSSQALGEADAILLADFNNTTGDPVFDGTLKQALAVKLEESPFLNVVSDQRVRETLGFMSRPADTTVTAAVAKEICLRQGIKATLLGDIATLGNTYVVTLRAENCQTGDVLAREQATASGKDHVLAALGDAATSMRRKLGESLASIDRNDRPIEQATTSSLEALKAFSLGDQKRNTGSDRDAVPFFRRALELDPEFALAHARLGTVYSNIGQAALSIEHRTRAYELRERVSERERLYISGHYYSGVARDNNKALETYDLWKQAYPRDAVPYVNSGRIYGSRGETDKAIAAYLKALELEPTLRFAYSNLIGAYLETGRLDEAQALIERQIKTLGETPETNQRLYDIAAYKGDRATTDRLAAILENSSVASSFLGTRAAEMAYYGRFQDWRKLSARQIELLRGQGLDERVGIVQSSQAVTAMFLGETKLARTLAEAVSQKGLEISANLAICYAAMGDQARAQLRFREVDLKTVPDDVARMFESTFHAALAVGAGDPQRAIERLKDLPPLTGRNSSGVANSLLGRADAYRLAKQFAEAERDYRAVLAWKSPFPFTLHKPLAHVGLARTLAATGDRDGARREYQAFLELWKEADPDLALLRDVKAELAKLES